MKTVTVISPFNIASIDKNTIVLDVPPVLSHECECVIDTFNSSLKRRLKERANNIMATMIRSSLVICSPVDKFN